MNSLSKITLRSYKIRCLNCRSDREGQSLISSKAHIQTQQFLIQDCCGETPPFNAIFYLNPAVKLMCQWRSLSWGVNSPGMRDSRLMSVAPVFSSLDDGFSPPHLSCKAGTKSPQLQKWNRNILITFLRRETYFPAKNSCSVRYSSHHVIWIRHG